MKSYFAYIRVSTTKQGEFGSSLQEQRSAIEAYAARHGHRISAWFEEQETAAKQGRKEFTRLTGLLRQGKADGVIIHKIDRSARNLKDWAGLGDLIDMGIEVLFAHEGLDMQTRGGRLAADIQAVVAADFIRNLREEVRKGFYGRLKQGYYPLKAPRGYLDQGKARAKLICPVIGPLVREAFQLYATGTWSLETLRHEMARRGLKGATGRPLSLDAIALMFHNPFYIGLMRISTRPELFEGNHVPLVPKALFDRVQAVMEGRLYPRVEKHEYPFRRLVTCADCGRSLTGERQKGRTYYRCHNRMCRGVSVVEERLNEAVRDAFAPLVLGPGVLGDLRDLMAEQVELEAGDREARTECLERDLALVEQRLERLTDAFIDGAIDKLTYEARKGGLIAERLDLRSRLQAGGGEVPFWQDVTARFEHGLALYLGYRDGSPEQRRRFINLAFSSIRVRGKVPEIVLDFPFAEITSWSSSRTKGSPPGFDDESPGLTELLVEKPGGQWRQPVPLVPQLVAAS